MDRRVPEARGVAWLLQRWLGFIFFTVFLGLWFQMPGLTGPDGILPASDFLAAVAQQFGFWHRLWLAPSVLWLGSGSTAVHLLCGIGLAASVLLLLNLAARPSLAVCLICFLSFIATAQAFASYQSDGMLMSAALIGLFLDASAPSWWSLFSLRWLWFTIYFGSGVAKMASGDPEWRHLTALDHYYENGPLPTWIGWYFQQRLPHALEAATALGILVVELGVAWLCFGPRRWRILCFWITTPMQIAIILTANYGFLNYLVLGLGLALLDDRHLMMGAGPSAATPHVPLRLATARGPESPEPSRAGLIMGAGPSAAAPHVPLWPARLRPHFRQEPQRRPIVGSAVLAVWVLITAANLARRGWPHFPAPARVSTALEPFRIVDPFGLFAVMTRERYEIEFQGSMDGETWTAYPFRYKPQDPKQAPGIYAPYQPRFDWNLWFASLDSYQDNPWVEQTELRLLQNNRTVLALFASNPFAAAPPRAVRAVRWQYWFSTPTEKRASGAWWTRREMGLYAPELAMTGQGVEVVEP